MIDLIEDSGSIRSFDYAFLTGWTETGFIPGVEIMQNVGDSIDVSEDGTVLVSGITNTVFQVHVYEWDGSGWPPATLAMPYCHSSYSS